MVFSSKILAFSKHFEIIEPDKHASSKKVGTTISTRVKTPANVKEDKAENLWESE